jgi:hypothetical protein
MVGDFCNCHQVRFFHLNITHLGQSRPSINSSTIKWREIRSALLSRIGRIEPKLHRALELSELLLRLLRCFRSGRRPGVISQRLWRRRPQSPAAKFRSILQLGPLWGSSLTAERLAEQKLLKHRTANDLRKDKNCPWSSPRHNLDGFAEFVL